MDIAVFALERYFAKHEFEVDHVLSASDCEPLSLIDLLGMADGDSLALWEGLSLGYTETQGHPLLRQEITGLYDTIEPADVLVAAPEEAIFIAMNVLLQPGDHVVVTHPAYQSLHEVAQALGCEVTNWWLEEWDGGWMPDPRELEAALNPRTKLIVINFPNNPTGCLPPGAVLDLALEAADRRGIYVFSDEMYRLLEHDETHRLPAVCDVYERSVSLFGLSKTFSLPGLRIGWLATRDRELLDRCARFKDYTTICSSAPSEVLGLMALRAKGRILERNRSVILDNLSTAEAFFARHEDLFAWIRPHGGSVAFPRYDGDIPIAQFCDDLRRRHSVLIVPGDLFGCPGGHFRIGLGRTDFPQALGRVEEHIEEGQPPAASC